MVDEVVSWGLVFDDDGEGFVVDGVDVDGNGWYSFYHVG